MLQGDHGFLTSQSYCFGLIALPVFHFGSREFADSDIQVIISDTIINQSISTILGSYITGLPDVIFARLGGNENWDTRYQIKVRQTLDYSDSS